MANRFDQAPQISFRQRPSTYVPQEFIGIPLEYLAGSLDKRQKEFDNATLKNENQKALFKPNGLRQVTAYGQSLGVNDYQISNTINQAYAQKSEELNDRLAKGDYTAIKDINKLGQEYQRNPYLKAINEREKYYNDVIAPLEKKQYKTEAEYYDLERKKFEFANSNDLRAWGTPQTYDYFDNVGETEKMFSDTAFDSKLRNSLGASLKYMEDGQGNRVPVLVEGTREENKRTADKLYATFINGFQGNKALQESISRNALAELYKAKNLGGSITITNKDNKPETFKVTDENFNDLYRKKFNEQMTDLMWYGINKYKTIEGGTVLDYSQLSKDYLDLFGFGQGGPNKPTAAGTETQAGGVDVGKYADNKAFSLFNSPGEYMAERMSSAYSDPKTEENMQLITSFENILKSDPKAIQGFKEYQKKYPSLKFKDFAQEVIRQVGGEFISSSTWFGGSDITESFKLTDAQKLFQKLAGSGVTQSYDYTINKLDGVENKNLLSMNTAKQFIDLPDNRDTKAADFRISISLASPSATIKYMPKGTEEAKTKTIYGDNLIKLGQDYVADYPYLTKETQAEHAHQIGLVTATTSTSKNTGYTLSQVLLNPNLLPAGGTDTFFNPLSNSEINIRRTTHNGSPAIAITEGGKDVEVINLQNVNLDPTLYTNGSDVVSKLDITNLGTFTINQAKPKQERK